MLAYLKRGGQMVLNFITPKKKLGWISFVFIGVLLLASVLVTTDFASAAADSGFWPTIAGWISALCLLVATFFLKLTIFALTFVISLGSYNNFINSTAVNYGWVMVRDITNMGFVIILLLIAFGTILGLEQYEWKKLMVKFVLAAILVNFSRVICGVIIDVGQVVMITFINGIAATAGGNLINMFNMGKIMSMTADTGTIVNSSEVLMASIAALMFAGMMLGTMAVFVYMLLARMITLWVLIVLSPLAFVLSVIPQTQKYASEWWQNFGNNVVSGPVIAFFLWLSFVTVGGGDVVSKDLNVNNSHPVSGASVAESDAAGSAAVSAGLSQAMSWEKMAGFAIAIGMLLVGAKVAQQLGVAGGSMMAKTTDFAKKAAMTVSGASAGIWAVKGAAAGIKKGAKAVGKGVLMNVPYVGGKSWQRRGKWAQEKILQGKTKFNETLGKRTGFQFGAHDKIMKEREAMIEVRKSKLSSSAKGFQGFKGEGEGGIERLRQRSDVLAGKQAVNKEGSEALRASRKAAASRELLKSDDKAKKKYATRTMAQKIEATKLDSAKTKVELDVMTGALSLVDKNKPGSGTQAQDYAVSLADRDINQNALIGTRKAMVGEEDTKIKNQDIKEQNEAAEIKGLEDSVKELAVVLNKVIDSNSDPQAIYANLPVDVVNKIGHVDEATEKDDSAMRGIINTAVQSTLVEKSQKLAEKRLDYGGVRVGGPDFEKQLGLLSAIKDELAKNPKNPDFAKINKEYSVQIPQVFGPGHDAVTKDYTDKIQNKNLLAAVAALEDMKKQKQEGKSVSMSAARVASDRNNPVLINAKIANQPATGKITAEFIQKSTGAPKEALNKLFEQIGVNEDALKGELSPAQVDAMKMAIKKSVTAQQLQLAGIDSGELEKLIDDLKNGVGGLRTVVKDQLPKKIS